MWRIKTNKFGNVRTTYKNEKYQSTKEADYARLLDFRVKGKQIKGWKRQVPIVIKINNIKICTYNLDFEVEHNDGSRELIEVKGFETAVWKLKKKLLEATFLVENPKVTYTIIK